VSVVLPVIDGHNDTLLAAHLEDRDGGAFLDSDGGGHLDLARATEAGLAAGLFAMFVPDERDDGDGLQERPPEIEASRARAKTFDMLADLHRWAAEGDELRLVGDAADLDSCIDGDAVGAIPHIEGAEAVQPDCSNLDLLYAAGVRSIGLTWSRSNAFGHGVPFTHDTTPDTGPGLTDAGRTLVRACEGRGIMVDLAHLNEAGFWDVSEETDRPLVVSHAGVHAISPAARNLTDPQLDAVAASDGLVGCTFALGHLREDGSHDDDAPLATLLDHVEYLADRMGTEHVALGSDFDGARIPDAVGDVTGLQRILDGLADRGFGQREREAIAVENWRRVLDAWWV
jgi:membrane dipeptidase